jgi:nucleoside-diphosphate-sugar epimerase
MVAENVRQFVFASSSSVYGDTTLVSAHEDDLVGRSAASSPTNIVAPVVSSCKVKTETLVTYPSQLLVGSKDVINVKREDALLIQRHP